MYVFIFAKPTQGCQPALHLKCIQLSNKSVPIALPILDTSKIVGILGSSHYVCGKVRAQMGPSGQITDKTVCLFLFLMNSFFNSIVSEGRVTADLAGRYCSDERLNGSADCSCLNNYKPDIYSRCCELTVQSKTDRVAAGSFNRYKT